MKKDVLKNKTIGLREKDGSYLPRIYNKKGKGIQSDRMLIKCGCCEKSVAIYHGDDEFLEINGVFASKNNWRKVLLPLLR